MSIRILLADDHRIMREGLRSLLEKQPDIEVVAEAEDGRTAVQLVRQLSPDVVIMDIAMPGLNGIGAAHQILVEGPGIKVIALSMHSDRRFVARMFKAGASGYLLKDCAFEELARAVRTVAANQFYLSPSIASIVIKDYVRRLTEDDFTVSSFLTIRQCEVLQLLAEGKDTNEVASLLQVSVKTVETHRRNVMNKLGVHSVAELTKYAIRAGLTSPER
jgi:DNA-binding NarL/FixJ family response regulator